MKKLLVIESVYNFLDLGIFVEIAMNVRKAGIKMNPKTFLKHLFFGRGYAEITPPQLSLKLNTEKDTPLIIDLRGKRKYNKEHINAAQQHSFDDFIGEVIMKEGYVSHKDQLMVLVCDTGQKSRVAASILSDEGFTKVASLKRGMRRWKRWERLSSQCTRKKEKNKKFHICKLF